MPERRFASTICPSTQTGAIFSMYSPILSESRRTGHGRSALVSRARWGSGCGVSVLAVTRLACRTPLTRCPSWRVRRADLSGRIRPTSAHSGMLSRRVSAFSTRSRGEHMVECPGSTGGLFLRGRGALPEGPGALPAGPGGSSGGTGGLFRRGRGALPEGPGGSSGGAGGPFRRGRGALPEASGGGRLSQIGLVSRDGLDLERLGHGCGRVESLQRGEALDLRHDP